MLGQKKILNCVDALLMICCCFWSNEEIVIFLCYTSNLDKDQSLHNAGGVSSISHPANTKLVPATIYSTPSHQRIVPQSLSWECTDDTPEEIIISLVSLRTSPK